MLLTAGLPAQMFRAAPQRREHHMKLLLSALVCGIVVTAGSSGAFAQNSEPSYKADPSVYTVIFEDANFRVIRGVRKKGQKDKPHSHPVPSIVYNVNNCKNKLYAADGKSVLRDNKAGTASAVPITASHSTENVGETDCTQIFVEKK
jgi:hypothetical protein